MPRPGERIDLHALKADGKVYRTWRSLVESVGDDWLVTVNHPGEKVGGPGGGWCMMHAARTYYWFDRPYNLMEVYNPNGSLKQIYIHIASPATFAHGVLSYTDHELDVVKRDDNPVRVLDEAEFRAAVEIYGYSAGFESSCREAVCRAMALAETWRPSGIPRSRGRRRGRRQRVRTLTPPAADSSTRSTEV